MKKNKNIKTYLTVLFVSSLLISNVITSKQIQLPFNITMTAAIYVFPITYILSDIFSEVYGYKWSRSTCYLGFLMNLLMVALFELAIITPSPSYWGLGEAFSAVLGSTPRVLVASLLAYVVGDLINDKVFAKMKSSHLTNTEGFGARAIISSIAGEFIDSFIFIPIAFFGQMPIAKLAKMMVVQVVLKTTYEIILLPVTNRIVKFIYKLEYDNCNE